MPKETIQPGKFVSLTYTISDADDNLLEQNDIPVNYIHSGDKELIGGMDQAVLGKSAGDMVEMEVPPEDGFGKPDPNLTFTDDLENVPPQLHQVGAEVEMQNESGEIKTFYVTKIEDGKLTVDGNHPLAGKTLKVRVNILEVRAPTIEDMGSETSGHTLN